MGEQILRLPQVCSKVGLGRDALYALIREKNFPPPIKITKKASGWTESEIDLWIKKRSMTHRGTSETYHLKRK